MKIPNTLLDQEGYPTDEYLEWIDSYGRDKEIESDLSYLDFIKVIEEGWAYNDWGFHLKRTYKGKKKLYLSTAGWSGNEEIISHLQNTWFWLICWVSNRRGGHYEFEIPIK